jgi:hypothetical protein
LKPFYLGSEDHEAVGKDAQDEFAALSLMDASKNLALAALR